jgi:hypothetical protein
MHWSRQVTLFVVVGLAIAVPVGFAFGQSVFPSGEDGGAGVPASECPEATHELNQRGVYPDSFVPACPTDEELSSELDQIDSTFKAISNSDICQSDPSDLPANEARQITIGCQAAKDGRFEPDRTGSQP